MNKFAESRRYVSENIPFTYRSVRNKYPDMVINYNVRSRYLYIYHTLEHIVRDVRKEFDSLACWSLAICIHSCKYCTRAAGNGNSGQPVPEFSPMVRREGNRGPG